MNRTTWIGKGVILLIIDTLLVIAGIVDENWGLVIFMSLIGVLILGMLLKYGGES